MILILDYQKSFTDENGKRHRNKSLVKCESCGKERSIDKTSATQGVGVKRCQPCRNTLDFTDRVPWNKDKKLPHETCEKIKKNNAKYWLGKKIPEKFLQVGEKHHAWQPDRDKLKANTKINFFIRQSLRSILRIKHVRSHFGTLGYSQDDLRKHLESTFQPWMNWSNYGNYYFKTQEMKWNIDHVKSIAQFLKEGVTDPKIVNALSNLRALDAMENFKKNRY